MKIILASKSPRRRQILEWAELPFDVISSEASEDYPADLSPDEVSIFIARQKALAVKNKLEKADLHPGHEGPVILAADTIVVLHNRIIGKPGSPEEARFTLQQLSGQEHRVITGVCILHNSGEIIFSETTAVVFHTLTERQITYYVKQYKPFDKAGSYAIQEWIGVIGIHSIRGDFYNVMGLPVSRVLQELQGIKIPE